MTDHRFSRSTDSRKGLFPTDQVPARTLAWLNDIVRIGDIYCSPLAREAARIAAAHRNPFASFVPITHEVAHAIHGMARSGCWG